MDPLLVVAPHIRVELAAELVEAGECPPIDELPLQNLVGGLDDGVVVRVALAGEGPSDAERLQQLVHTGVRELAMNLNLPPDLLTSGFPFRHDGRRRGRGGHARFLAALDYLET